MEAVLLEFLNRLEAIGSEHEELLDDERVQEAVSEVVFEGFLKQQASYHIPLSFALPTKRGNKLVRDALVWFLIAAGQAVQQDGLDTFHKRFAVLRLPHIHTESWSDAADFFGWWWNAEDFDEFGNPHG